MYTVKIFVDKKEEPEKTLLNIVSFEERISDFKDKEFPIFHELILTAEGDDLIEVFVGSFTSIMDKTISKIEIVLNEGKTVTYTRFNKVKGASLYSESDFTKSISGVVSFVKE